MLLGADIAKLWLLTMTKLLKDFLTTLIFLSLKSIQPKTKLPISTFKDSQLLNSGVKINRKPPLTITEKELPMESFNGSRNIPPTNGLMK